jgi:hypothetical protein
MGSPSGLYLPGFNLLGILSAPLGNVCAASPQGDWQVHMAFFTHFGVAGEVGLLDAVFGLRSRLHVSWRRMATISLKTEGMIARSVRHNWARALDRHTGFFAAITVKRLVCQADLFRACSIVPGLEFSSLSWSRSCFHWSSARKELELSAV